MSYPVRSLNSINLVGRVGKEPVISAGQRNKYGKFYLATNETYKAEGEKKTRVDWHPIKVFGKLAEFCEKYLTKGSLIAIEAKGRSSFDSENKKSYYNVQANNITILEKKAEKKPDEWGDEEEEKEEAQETKEAQVVEEDDDEFPF